MEVLLKIFPKKPTMVETRAFCILSEELNMILCQLVLFS